MKKTPAPGVKQKKDSSRPGRRPSVPDEYRDALCARVKQAREKNRGLSQEEVAEQLSALLGRTIEHDTYRHWEKRHLIAHDAVVPFCAITHTDVYELLTGQPYRLGQLLEFPPAKRKT